MGESRMKLGTGIATSFLYLRRFIFGWIPFWLQGLRKVDDVVFARRWNSEYQKYLLRSRLSDRDVGLWVC